MHQDIKLGGSNNGHLIKVKLLELIDSISPTRLKSISHHKYVRQLSSQVTELLVQDTSCFFTLIETIKRQSNPSYKRDTTIEILHNMVASDSFNILERIFCKPFLASKSVKPWKEMANSIASIPDIVADSNVLKKMFDLRREEFNIRLLRSVYKSLEYLSEASDDDLLDQEHRLFFLQLIGRIAISTSQSQLVWKEFTSRAIREKKLMLKSLISSIFRLAATTKTTTNNNVSSSLRSSIPQGEIFIEHLYLPIFYHMKPTKQNGGLIMSLLGDDILSNKYIEYIICDKTILKANYNLDRRRQNIILCNIFAYLSSLVNHGRYIERSSTSSSPSSSSSSLPAPPAAADSSLIDGDEKDINLLIKTLLEVVNNWSNGTRILLRVHEHNKFITCALLVAFKYALEYDRLRLVRHLNEIQSTIIRAIPIYLNRASHEQRNIALCVGRLLLPKIHQLILEQSSGNIDTTKAASNVTHHQKNGTTTSDVGNIFADLRLDADTNDDLLQLQNLLECDVDELFSSYDDASGASGEGNNETNGDGCQSKYTLATNAAAISVGHISAASMPGGATTEQPTPSDDGYTKSMRPGLKQSTNDGVSRKESSSRASDLSGGKKVVLLDPDSDDELEANDSSASSEDDSSDLEELTKIGENSAAVPIYLRDCIDGLNDSSSSARYVKLCLIRAGELINQMLDHEQSGADSNKSVSSYKRYFQSDNVGQTGRISSVRETIRDVGIELAQCLVYLNNQYNIKEFSSYRLKALTLLNVCAPDLIGKYLIDELNGPRKSLQLQFELLQVLVASARYLSGDETASLESLIAKDQANNTEKTSRLSLAQTRDTPTSGDNVATKNDCDIACDAPSTDTRTFASIESKIDKGTTTKKKTVTRRDKRPDKINKFAEFGSMYFYGIVYRLKADFNAKCDVISHPQTIVSSMKLQDDFSDGYEQPEKRIFISDGRALIAESPPSSSSSRLNNGNNRFDISQSPNGLDDVSGRGVNMMKSSGGSMANKIDESINDDNSYLLSRILFSISIIITCLDQQPITCRLSSDLLDILAVYRCHPDPGVQKAILSCLKVIKDCTPSVYFDDNIKERLLLILNSMVVLS